jgi:hypothetical protein
MFALCWSALWVALAENDVLASANTETSNTTSRIDLRTLHLH